MLSACSLSEMKKQAEEAENTAIFMGQVNVQTDQKGDIIVVLIRPASDKLFTVENHIEAGDNGKFTVYAKPGTYFLGAFVDVDNNGLYTKGEHARIYGDLKPIEIYKGQVIKANINITGDLKWKIPSDAMVLQKKSLSVKNIGRIISLDHPMFALETGTLGLWKPIDYLEQYGAGLFLLQKYEKNKIPIIFVHGANAASGVWGDMIAKLDRKHFQPWVFNYPSGVRLDLASEYLKRAVSELQHKYNMKQVYIIAHSMGGLVTRSFIKKYYKEYQADAKKIKFVMTINSPMMGMASAASGVKYSPILVPSWRDVATGSKFIKRVHAWAWPKTLPYHLVFSYEHGEGDDGVVELESQIPLKLQSEATRMYGFNNTHAGILHDKIFITQFHKILRKSLN
jgi:pimeloyl-ACP methyl ester carboxylesterase